MSVIEMLTQADLAREYGGSEATWERRRWEGNGPRFVKIGRAVRYRRSAIEEWLTENTFSSTAENKPKAKRRNPTRKTLRALDEMHQELES